MSFLSTFFGLKSETTDKIAMLDRATYADAIMMGNVQLVDVRTPREYKSGHIRHAINIDFYDKVNFERSFEKMDMNKPVYLYCRSSARSQRAARILVDMGFPKIYDLKGGYMRWG